MLELRLFPLAKSILAAIVDYYNDPDVEERVQLPERQYVSDGLPAYDMAQLTVHITRTYRVDENGNDSATYAMGSLVRFGAEFVITILRDTVVVDEEGIADFAVPSVDDIEDVAELLHGDVERIIDALVTAVDNGGLPGCNTVAMGQWTSYGPEGGLVGGAHVVRMTLD